MRKLTLEQMEAIVAYIEEGTRLPGLLKALTKLKEGIPFAVAGRKRREESRALRKEREKLDPAIETVRRTDLKKEKAAPWEGIGKRD